MRNVMKCTNENTIVSGKKELPVRVYYPCLLLTDDCKNLDTIILTMLITENTSNIYAKATMRLR